MASKGIGSAKSKGQSSIGERGTDTTVEDLFVEKDFDISKFFVEKRRFKKDKLLGKGGQGCVYLATDLENGTPVALKKVTMNWSDDDVKRQYEREVGILSTVRHPALLGLVGFTPIVDELHNPIIVTPYMAKGSVDTLIDQESKGQCPREWDVTRKHIVLYGTACGMAYMHKHRLLHRDLKPANILLDENMEPKISDFGLSKFVNSGETMQQSQSLGTPCYVAPEVVDISGSYGFKSDVFSFGMTMYAVLSGSAPKISMSSSILSGARPPKSQKILPEYWKLIEDCWDQDQDMRPCFEEIVARLESLPDGMDSGCFLRYREKVHDQVRHARVGNENHQTTRNGDDTEHGSKSGEPVSDRGVCFQAESAQSSDSQTGLPMAIYRILVCRCAPAAQPDFFTIDYARECDSLDSVTHVVTPDGQNIALEFSEHQWPDPTPKLTNMAMASVDGFIILYSVHSRQSFEIVEEVITRIKDNGPVGGPFVICGRYVTGRNREVSRAQGEAIGDKYGVPFLEVTFETRQDRQNICLALSRAMKSTLQNMKSGKGKKGKKGRKRKECTVC